MDRASCFDLIWVGFCGWDISYGCFLLVRYTDNNTHKRVFSTMLDTENEKEGVEKETEKRVVAMY